MANWRSENIVLTQKGKEVLSKVQAGVGKLTVSKIVTGGGSVANAQLVNQTAVKNEKQRFDIAGVTTSENGSNIDVQLSNTDLTTAYDLHQIGIYVTHPDFSGEVLYYLAQCENPDRIPLPSETPLTLNFALYMTHHSTKNVTINVTPSGFVSTQKFNELKQFVDTHINDDEKHLTAELKNKITQLPNSTELNEKFDRKLEKNLSNVDINEFNKKVLNSGAGLVYVELTTTDNGATFVGSVPNLVVRKGTVISAKFPSDVRGAPKLNFNGVNDKFIKDVSNTYIERGSINRDSVVVLIYNGESWIAQEVGLPDGASLTQNNYTNADKAKLATYPNNYSEVKAELDKKISQDRVIFKKAPLNLIEDSLRNDYSYQYGVSGFEFICIKGNGSASNEATMAVIKTDVNYRTVSDEFKIIFDGYMRYDYGNAFPFRFEIVADLSGSNKVCVMSSSFIEFKPTVKLYKSSTDKLIICLDTHKLKGNGIFSANVIADVFRYRVLNTDKWVFSRSTANLTPSGATLLVTSDKYIDIDKLPYYIENLINEVGTTKTTEFRSDGSILEKTIFKNDNVLEVTTTFSSNGDINEKYVLKKSESSVSSVLLSFGKVILFREGRIEENYVVVN